MPNTVTYEHPVNEKVRILLRLEHLFQKAAHFVEGRSPWDSRVTVDAYMEVLDIFGRGDLKTELLKEMERAAANLEQLLEHPDVDHERLGNILRALERLRSNLAAHPGPLGQALREDEFLGPIRQRCSIPGGTCDFDLPGFHQWLERPPEGRRQDLQRWASSLDAVRQPVELLLKLIRNSAGSRLVTAERGSYQQSLDHAQPYQLIRISVDDALPCFAEVSGGKHRFTVRFLRPTDGRPVPMEDDVQFRLSCCSL